MSLQDSLGHNCGGSVVAPDMIMTAGHCSALFDTVVVGLYNLSDFLSSGGATTTSMIETFGIEKENLHSSHQFYTMQFDVMLIKLDGEITVVDPVRINDDPNTPVVNDTLMAVGWGVTRVNHHNDGEDDFEFPQVMQEVDLSYVPNLHCRQINNDQGLTLERWLFEDMMCAANEGKDSCSGDSGGPLLKLGTDPSEDIQVGIISWGPECGGPIPGIYHRLSYTYEWIRETVCTMSNAPPDSFHCDTLAPSVTPTVPRVTFSPSISPTSSLAIDDRRMDITYPLLMVVFPIFWVILY